MLFLGIDNVQIACLDQSMADLVLASRLLHAASNTPHTHPRGSEISTVLSGSITFGMIEENALFNVPIIRPQLSVGQTIHIPQGLLSP